MSGLETTTENLAALAETAVSTAQGLGDLRQASNLALAAIESRKMTTAQVATFKAMFITRCTTLGLRAQDAHADWILDDTPPTLRGAS